MSGPEILRIALGGVAANKLRSGLTILGMTIGVAAVIILVAVGNGSKVAIQSSINALGSNVLLVQAQGGGFGPGRGAGTSVTFTQRDVDALGDTFNAPDVKRVSPVVNASGTTLVNGFDVVSAELGHRDGPGLHRDALLQDRQRRDVHRRRRQGAQAGVVLGPTVVTNLFSGADPGGLDGARQRHGLPGRGRDRGQGLQRPAGPGRHRVRADDRRPGRADRLRERACRRSRSRPRTPTRSTRRSPRSRTILDERKHVTDPTNPGFQVINQGAVREVASASTDVFTTLLGAVAAISLLVGGIGVMNIMLVSVTERTREIGIRKAIGARRADILAQFLTEAVVI